MVRNVDDLKLNISPTLQIDALKFVESKTAILGQSGTGKSGLLKVLEEELVGVGLPLMVIDPAGIAWGLQASKTGKPNGGLQILVIGGEHGNLPLNTRAGAETARALVEANASAIIDISDTKTADYQRFLTDFCHELYVAQGKSKTPRLLVIDEAHEILPQDKQKQDSESFNAVRKIITRGRNRGLGVVLVSQRPAGIAKSVLTQCGTMMLFSVLGTPDVKAIREWISAWGQESKIEQFMKEFAAMEPQHCIVWSPRDLKVFEQIRVRDFRTFHPDLTHLRRTGLLEVQPATVDVKGLVATLSGAFSKITEERVEARQVPELRREVERLQAKLAVKVPSGATKAEVDRAVREARAPLEAELEVARTRAKQLEGWGEKVAKALSAVPGLPQPTLSTSMVGLTSVTKVKIVGDWAPMPGSENGAKHERSSNLLENDGEKSVTPSGRRMLEELAKFHPGSLALGELATLARVSRRSSGLGANLNILKAKGWVEEGREGRLKITQEGIAEVGDVPPMPTDHQGLVEMWLQKLPSAPRKVLTVLAEGPEPVEFDRETIAERTGISITSSGLGAAISMLEGNGLLDRLNDGRVAASRNLWPTS